MINSKKAIVGSANAYFAWLETAVITVLTVLVWIQADVAVTEATQAHFFWPILGPLLLSLRYGLAKGLSCALLSIGALAGYMHLAGHMPQFPLSFAVGMLITTLIAGEFQNYWSSVNTRQALEHQSMSEKLDSFTKHYHLLKVSHDQLEQRSAGQTNSLRSSINALRLIAEQHDDLRLSYLAEPILNLLSEVGGLEVAGIYEVDEMHVNAEPAYEIGDHHLLAVSDPMLIDMIQSKKLLSVAKLAEKQIHKSRYQLCIPLVNTHGDLKAIVVAEQAKFFMLTPSNIALLSLIANLSADLISDEIIATTLQPHQNAVFVSYLERARYANRAYEADSTVIICVDTVNKHNFALSSIIERRRGADIYWSCTTKDGQRAIAVLLPMTTLYGAQQYANRLKDLIYTDIGPNAGEVEIIGPLSVGRDWSRIQLVMEQLGAYDENLDGSANSSLSKLKRALGFS